MLRSQSKIAIFLASATLLYLIVYTYGRKSPGDSYAPGYGSSGQGAKSYELGFYDKVVVVASTSKSDTSWVAEELPDWRHAIYVVDDKSAPLHTKINKGNEANVFLTYLIDNYDALPEVAVFVHDHREASHIENLFSSNPDSIQQLNLENVKKVGYQSLSCGMNYVCKPDSYTKFWSRVDDHMLEAWPFLFPDTKVVDMMSGPCCAQFAVSKAAMRYRSKADYQRMHKWLMETKQDTYYSGRVFEYTWHYIFGKPSYYCNPRDQCACDGFDICDLKSHQADRGLSEDPAIEREKQLKEYEEFKTRVLPER